MSGPLFFGDMPRFLFGMLHPAVGQARDAMLVCQPLLQDGLSSHRSLWALAEGLAKAGTEVLRFDWYGSGDSAGNDDEILLAGMLSDLQHADALLASVSHPLPRRWLALRSAAIPLLAHATVQRGPVDLVLWDPSVSGRELVAGWGDMHSKQLAEVGRFPHGHAPPLADDLLGFQLAPQLLSSLEAFDACQLPLPAGSRVLMVMWNTTPAQQHLIEHLRRTGTNVECLLLEADDAPQRDDPERYESQSFPRRSVTRLLGHLNGSACA